MPYKIGSDIRLMHSYLISLGSNTPDASQQLQQAFWWLASTGLLRKVSHIYTTPDIKNPQAPPYHNAVALVECDREPDAMNALTKGYEHSMHREHGTGRVIIDLDVVTCDDDVLRPRDYTATYFVIGLHALAVPDF